MDSRGVITSSKKMEGGVIYEKFLVLIYFLKVLPLLTGSMSLMSSHFYPSNNFTMSY